MGIEHAINTLEPPLEGTKFRRVARDWIERRLPDSLRADLPDYKTPSLEELKRWEVDLYQAGLAGITWPKAYGGHGRTLREHLIANQEIGRLAIPESMNSIGKELAGPIILAIGTEEQKKRYLPAILDMREIWCQGFSEPEAGSDLAGLRTRAVRTDGGWLISGQKIWTSGGLRAQRCLLLARTGKQEDRHRGLALFALKMDAPGVRVAPVRQMNGLVNFCEVFLDEAFVADEDALGQPDEGWRAAIRVLAIERATNRIYRAWRFENELSHLVSACLRDAELTKLLNDGFYRRWLSSVVIDIEIVKAHAENAVDALMGGASINSRGSISKLHWSEAHQRFVATAMEMLSQARTAADPYVRRAQSRFRELYLSTRSETIYAGTTEIQLNIVADRILQLPRAK